MTRSELQAAAESLRAAADAAPEDAGARLAEQADAVAALADREYGPDHGRLARLEHALRDLREAAPADAAAHVDEAIDAVQAYRETVEGV